MMPENRPGRNTHTCADRDGGGGVALGEKEEAPSHSYSSAPREAFPVTGDDDGGSALVVGHNPEFQRDAHTRRYLFTVLYAGAELPLGNAEDRRVLESAMRR